MPTVPRVSTPTVGLEVSNQPKARVMDVSSGALALGQSIDKAADTGLDIIERLDTTAAEEAMVNFERAKNDVFFNPETGYFNTQGRNAVDGAEPTSKQLETLARQHSQALRSAQARRLFDRAVQGRIARDQQSILQHASKGQKVYEIATLAAQQENAIENGALYFANDEELEISRQSGRMSVTDQAGIEGVDAQILAERLQTFESIFTKSAISAALDGNNVARAQTLFDKYESRLEGPDKVAVQKALTKATDDLYVLGKVNEIMAQADTLAEMQPLINAETDPVKRKAIQTEATNEYNRREKIKTERIEKLYDDLGTAVFTGQIRVRDITVEQAELLGASKISALQRFENEIASGKKIVTNEAVKNKLDAMLPEELAKIDPFAYRGDLSDNDFTALQARWRTAKAGDEKAEDTFGRTKATALNQTIEQIFGKKAKAEQVNAFSRMVGEQAKAEGIKDMKGYEELLARMSTRVVKERDYWFDTTQTLKNIPAEHQPALAAELRRVGREVNPANMLQLYELAKKKGMIK